VETPAPYDAVRPLKENLMSELVNRSERRLDAYPARAQRSLARRQDRALAQIDARAELEHYRIGREADLAVARTVAASYVASRAIEAAGQLASVEQAVVMMEPAAVNRVAYLAQKSTFMLADIMDEFGKGLTR